MNQYDDEDLGAMLKKMDAGVNKKTMKQLANIQGSQNAFFKSNSSGLQYLSSIKKQK